MSCNGCRVLRKGCNDNCILRQSLQGIQSPEAQAHATVFVAKFFGRAGLMSFLSGVPENQRPALFQSLLFEACGRTINPVNGAVGLLWTGNWHVCQTAVETVLRGGTVQAIPNLTTGVSSPVNEDNTSDIVDYFGTNDQNKMESSRRFNAEDLELSLTSGMRMSGKKKRRETTPSDVSETTTFESGSGSGSGSNVSLPPQNKRVYRLFL